MNERRKMSPLLTPIFTFLALICLVSGVSCGHSQPPVLQYTLAYGNEGNPSNEPALKVAENYLNDTLNSLKCDDNGLFAKERWELVVRIKVLDRHSKNESYLVRRFLTDERSADVISVEGVGVLGTVFGVFAFAQQCRVNPCQCGGVEIQHTEPSFTLRTLSEEGQLLDLPDRGYRLDTNPYLNTSKITEECAYIQSTLVPEMLKHGFNSLTILHHDLEEYVTYKYLSGVSVYAADDPHVNRSAALSLLIKSFVNTLHSYHLTVFIQPYEVSCPPVLCKLNLYAGSPDLDHVLQARYREFFELTDVDGVIVTVSDSWSPRAGYQFHKAWTNAKELAQVATSFHDAIVNKCNKTFICRLWQWNGGQDWEALLQGTPSDLIFSVKVTAGDYLLDQPIHPLLAANSTAPQQRPIMVLVDVFREYNGWAKTVCYVQQWDARLKQVHKLGVRMLNVWGAWSPGCTWPDSGSQLINGTAGQYKSWQGLYNNYRVYTASPDMIFSGARPSAYLLYRLAMNIGDDMGQITADFGSLYFGKANSEHIANALFVTQDAYLNALSYPRSVADFVVQWAVVFNPVDSKLEVFPKITNYSELLEVNGNVRRAILYFNGNLSNVAAPPSQDIWQSFNKSAAITVLYWSSLITWRQIYHLNHSLALGHRTTCALLSSSLSEWHTLMANWDTVAPEQGEDWEITRVSRKLESRPDFFHAYVSFNDYVRKIESNFNTHCTR
ncbi:uncharacterized protein LOC135822251 [Sycon ciliatum]|uniref:uncharacterized protein LOC135822251 n=1 Tax=Sycon ciliatum TaxID=27933 RepID=UPI0031F636BC